MIFEVCSYLCFAIEFYIFFGGSILIYYTGVYYFVSYIYFLYPSLLFVFFLFHLIILFGILTCISVVEITSSENAYSENELLERKSINTTKNFTSAV